MRKNLDFIFITNDIKKAVFAEKQGVEIIMIDLEINGKLERQGHLDTVISRHMIDDVKKIKRALLKAILLVRVNPLYSGSEAEINRVIQDGADEIMLPMFTNAQEVKTFIKLINGRAKCVLLLETAQAMVRLDEIISIQGIDMIHIGLNDLHLSLHLSFMFELLTSDIMNFMVKKIQMRNIEVAIGGIGIVGSGVLPAEYIVKEYARLGVKRTILSRTFSNEMVVNDENNRFYAEISKLRALYEEHFFADEQKKNQNTLETQKIIKKIVSPDY